MKDRDITDLEDCMYKIESLLKEYNCQIGYSSELRQVELVDLDTNRFEVISKIVSDS